MSVLLIAILIMVILYLVLSKEEPKIIVIERKAPKFLGPDEYYSQHYKLGYDKDRERERKRRDRDHH